MLPRTLTFSISSLALGALSCQLPTPSAFAGFPVEPAPPAAVAAGPPDLPTSAEAESVDPIVAVTARYLASRRMGLAPHEVQEVAETIVAEAIRHDMDPRLVLAVMRVESGYYNFAMSPVGAIGLMQIMPATGEEMAIDLLIPWRGPQTLFDPIANIRMGVAYLRILTDRYGSVPTALAAYNWGPTRIDRRLRRGSPLPMEYAGLVLQAYDGGRGARSS
ncbi:MAG: lytic transglycosylase domain-containing protein [Myxococcota bacterium]